MHRLENSRFAYFLLTICAYLSLSGTAWSFTGTSGAVVPTPAPPSLLRGAFESDTSIALIEEQSNFVLPAAVSVDADGVPGLYQGPGDLTGATLLAGTRVGIQLLHFDPIGSTNIAVRLTGAVTFENPVLGLALRRATLFASDVYGVPGTVYPSLVEPGFREFEFGQSATGVSDTVQVSADRRTLFLDWGATANMDQLRVFTAVPEPCSMAMLGALALGARVGRAQRTQLAGRK